MGRSGRSHWYCSHVLQVHRKEAYPRIFVLELDKEIKVAAKLEQIDGLGLYQRLPRGWIEEVQMMELCSAISLIIMAPVLDRWAWTLDDSSKHNKLISKTVIGAEMEQIQRRRFKWQKVKAEKLKRFRTSSSHVGETLKLQRSPDAYRAIGRQGFLNCVQDDTHLIEADLVFDDENLLIETEIQDADDIDEDHDAEEDFVATPSKSYVIAEISI
nr:hypothetical protein [Tanacetum cinerariifolium]